MDFSESENALTTMKTHLREKYLNDIDVIQRATYSDSENWDKLDLISQQIQDCKKLLGHIDDLTLSPTKQLRCCKIKWTDVLTKLSGFDD